MNRVIFGDCRDTMRDLKAQGVRVQCCVTSPPYFGLRDYGHPGQIGLEKTPAEYVAALVEVFECVRELLADDGVLWLNLGDSYARNGGEQGGGNRELLHLEGSQSRMLRIPDGSGLKAKDLIGIPWRVAFALQAAGWYLRQDIIWHKPNPMPESVTDRCTKAHEYIFMLSKSARYFYDQDAIKEPAVGVAPGDLDGGAQKKKDGSNANDGRNFRTDKQRGHSRRHAGFNDRWDAMTKAEQCSGLRNRRSVWTVPTVPYSGAHFATFPPALIEPCILAGSRPGDVVLDPFMGSGTTAQVAQALGRQWIGCELNSEYAPLQQARTAQAALAIYRSGSAGAVGTPLEPGVRNHTATKEKTMYEIEQVREATKMTTTIETWLPEARVIAAQCWCDDTTKHVAMSPELAEVVAYKIAAWMETGAFHARNEVYWRERAQRAEGVFTVSEQQAG